MGKGREGGARPLGKDSAARAAAISPQMRGGSSTSGAMPFLLAPSSGLRPPQQAFLHDSPRDPDMLVDARFWQRPRARRMT